MNLAGASTRLQELQIPGIELILPKILTKQMIVN